MFIVRIRKKTLVEYFGDFVQDIKVILNRIATEMGKKLSKSTIRRFLRKHKFGYKRIRKITSLKKDDVAFQFFKQETERRLLDTSKQWKIMAK